MSSKTCGERCYFTRTNNYDMCAMYAAVRKESDCISCEYFTQKVITNGDKIVAGGMRAIAEFALHHCCNNCIYFDGNNPYRSTCGKPDNETCEDGTEAWLNAPAESEGKDE